MRKKSQIMIFLDLIVPPQVLKLSQFLIMLQSTELPDLSALIAFKLKSRTMERIHLTAAQAEAIQEKLRKIQSQCM